MSAAAADQPYTLFNPAPSDSLRPLNSDQYDNVLDAHTLDAGHVQLETSLVNYYYYSARHDFPGLSYKLAEEEYNWSPRIRVGLLQNVEFEAHPSYSIDSDNVKGAYSSPYFPYAFNSTTRSSGFGNLDLGSKINLWGNDGGMMSLAVHPYVSIPTDHGIVAGGVSVPFGLALPGGLYLKIETEISADHNYHHTIYGGFYNAISLHKTLCSKSDAFAYLDSTASSDPNSSWYGYAGFGATYNITRNLQLFGAMGFGVVNSAYDYNPRFGVVARF